MRLLWVVNESGAGVQTQRGIAGSVEFHGAAKIESIAPGAFVGRGIVGNKRLVVVNEAVTQIEEQSPALQEWGRASNQRGLLAPRRVGHRNLNPGTDSRLIYSRRYLARR